MVGIEEEEADEITFENRCLERKASQGTGRCIIFLESRFLFWIY